MEASVAAEPWQRTLYVALAAPAAIIALADGGRLQNWSARRLLGQPIRTTRVRGLLRLPLALLALVIMGYGWSIVVLNVAYPMRPLLGLPVMTETPGAAPPGPDHARIASEAPSTSTTARS